MTAAVFRSGSRVNENKIPVRIDLFFQLMNRDKCNAGRINRSTRFYGHRFAGLVVTAFTGDFYLFSLDAVFHTSGPIIKFYNLFFVGVIAGNFQGNGLLPV